MREGSYIRLWLDHPRLGCGYRAVVITKIGRRFVHLFYPPTLVAFTVERERFPRRAEPVRWIEPADLRRRIRDNRDQAKRLALSFSHRAVTGALAALRAAEQAQGHADA